MKHTFPDRECECFNKEGAGPAEANNPRDLGTLRKRKRRCSSGRQTRTPVRPEATPVVVKLLGLPIFEKTKMDDLTEAIDACYERHAKDLEAAKQAVEGVKRRIIKDLGDIVVRADKWQAPLRHCVLLTEVTVECNFPSDEIYYQHYITYPGHSGRLHVPDFVKPDLSAAVGSVVTHDIVK